MSDSKHAADCTCCQGLSPETPAEISNRPGLSAIAYRVGTQPRFRQSMLARLAASPALRGLDTQSDKDFTVAVVDAFAVLGDVLSFYDERIANESYLRTATERRSLIELARLVGYEPRPGVAASAHLAFTVSDGPGSPDTAIIDVGAKVQSVPGPGERPQTFETTARLEARAAWNALRPRRTRPQAVNAGAASMVLEGTLTRLQPGDAVLLVEEGAAGKKALRRIKLVNVDIHAQQTTVTFEDGADTLAPAAAPAPLAASLSQFTQPLRLTDNNVQSAVVQRRWSERDLKAFALMQGWSLDQVLANVRAQVEKPVAAGQAGAFALRVRASLFGYNAIDWRLLPAEIKTATGNAAKTDWKLSVPPAGVLDLDAAYLQITVGSWVVITQPAASSGVMSSPTVATVSSRVETGVTGYGMGGRITEIKIDATVAIADMDALRRTVVHAGSERLALAEVPIADPVQGSTIELSTMVDKLQEGQAILVTGELADSAGVVSSEVATIAAIFHAGGRTTLELTDKLGERYARSTVVINANVALATHGESCVKEVIGSGDGAQPFQRFSLRQPPLTHVPAPTPSGAASTLEVRVNDLLWNEVPSLYGHGPNDRVYITRLDDDDTTEVQFGDGITGARLPTGVENIQATYRKGIGADGMVGPGKLTLLLTRPLGVSDVTNPLAASVGADREGPLEIRTNAALTVHTLGRIVSLQDYEDFARAYAGVANALASWVWDGSIRVVVVTVADAKGAPIPDDSLLPENLLAAMRAAGDPLVDVRVVSYRRALFRVRADVEVDAQGPPADKVLARVKQSLTAHFSVAARAFGQGVALSEVLAAVHQTPGVVGVSVTAFHRVEKDEKVEDALPAEMPSASASGLVGAELLTIDPGGIDLKEMS